MGATNRFQLSYVAEVTKGVQPATPAYKNMRVTSSGIVASPTRVTSNEIRSDRQVTDQILTALGSGGPVGFELSFKAHDDMIEAALQGTWTNKPSRDNAGVADSVITNVATVNEVLTCTTGASFVVGQLALFSGFGVAGNNGVFRCTQASATVPRFVGAGLTDETVPPAAARVQVCGFRGASADITATATGLGSTALDFTTLGLQAGEWVKVGGDTAGSQFATAANNSWARVSSATAPTATAVTFDILPVGWGVDAGTGKTIEVYTGDFVKNGTTQRSFTIEAQQQDIAAPSYEYFTGEQLDQLALTLKAGAVISGTYTFTGQGTPTAGTVRTAGATDVAAPTFSVLNAASNVGRLAMNGVVVGSPSYLMEIGLDLKNNLAGQSALNNIAPVGIRNGEINLSGALNAYFGDLVLLNAVLADSDTSLMFRTGRSDGNRESLLFDVPAAKVSGTAPVSGKNADRMFTGSFAAKKHATLGFTISGARYWYLPVAA